MTKPFETWSNFPDTNNKNIQKPPYQQDPNYNRFPPETTIPQQKNITQINQQSNNFNQRFQTSAIFSYQQNPNEQPADRSNPS